MITLSFSGIWNIPGIFQKNATTRKIFHFMEYGIFWNIPKKSYHNQKCHFNIPFLSFNNFIFDILWNMEYSKILPQQDIFSIFGIWNIPNKTGTRQILKSVEYGIFAEYSKKIVKQSKYQKFWNMEYSIEYSWNIPKIVKQATGA